jgi:processive 1,2-diacylglycerol beta-glucosyltransferase
VFTAGSGAGHDSQAEAFKEWAASLWGGSVEVRIEHLAENSSGALRALVDFYNFIQRRAPWFHHLYFQWIECFDLVNGGGVAFGAAYYRELLREWRPDVILSVHDCFNRGYFEEARRVLGPGVRCVTYCAEFGGGYGFSRGWVNREADLFLGRTEATVDAAVRLGFSREKARAVGFLLRPGFYAEDGREATEAWLRRETGWGMERPILLLATGGAGAQNHLAVLRALEGRDLRVIALCGKDPAAAERVRAWGKSRTRPEVHAMGATPAMPELMRCASMVFARAGSETAAEALQSGCPIIFNTIGTAMPQETLNIRWFKERGVARCAGSARALARVVGEWLDQPELFAEWRRRFRACAVPGRPDGWLPMVLGGGE